MKAWPREETAERVTRRIFKRQVRRDRPDVTSATPFTEQMPLGNTLGKLRRELELLHAPGGAVIEVAYGEKHFRAARPSLKEDRPQKPKMPGVVLSFTGLVAGRPTRSEEHT